LTFLTVLRFLFHSGLITKAQFSNLATTFLPKDQYDSEFVNRLFNAFDENRSGTIDFKEFVLGISPFPPQTYTPVLLSLPSPHIWFETHITLFLI
jgi:hypothetical protein